MQGKNFLMFSAPLGKNRGRLRKDYQAILPQGRKAADGRKPRHSLGDINSKRKRGFSVLRIQSWCVRAGFLH